jgi:hypothetical protein
VFPVNDATACPGVTTGPCPLVIVPCPGTTIWYGLCPGVGAILGLGVGTSCGLGL